MATVEEIRQYLEGIRDERRESANTATRVGTALLMLLHYMADDTSPFLRKDREDETKYLLKLLAGCVIGETGGIKLNADGSITCQRIRVDGSAIFDELVFNYQNVLEGDTYFTDRGIIESVERTDLTQYVLTFRKQYDDDHVTFHSNDILMGTVNRLDKAKSFYKFWLRVDSVDTEANTATCTAYDDGDVPGGENFAPVAAARVIRWGNTTDTDRQNVWFVSSNDGRWLFLQGVTKPVLDDTDEGSNYAGFIGLPPDIAAVRQLIEDGRISSKQPYAYFRGIIVQDVIRVDYKGAPVYTARDCGQWNASRKYIHGYDDNEKGWYSDRVWWGGCYWECSVESCSGSEPRRGNADWTCLMGGSNMSISILSSKGNFFPAGKHWATALTAYVWNADMRLEEKDLTDCTITWLRESDDSDGDTIWNKQHETVHTLTLDIDSDEDLPSGWGKGSEVGYRIYLVMPDGSSYDHSYTIAN